MQSQKARNGNVSIDIARLEDELRLLQQHYEPYLDQEDVKDDLSRIALWIADYKEGDAFAIRRLRQQGYSLLERIQQKLKIAAEDLERMDGESPAAKTCSGGDVHHFSKAAGQAAKAEQNLHALLQKTTTVH